MAWPTPQDYNEAVQTPAVCFSDPDLRSAQPQLTHLGLPKPNSGAFASVYKMSRGARHWAVRCFLRNITNQHDRYRRISTFVLNDDLPYTVDFAYLEQGINIRGTWYPILKMDWVDGHTMESYVRTNLGDPAALTQLVHNFRQMHVDLQRSGIAHGDLQHGNIIITPGRELRLVDYDGMFVPSLAGASSNELGHPNYQHPQRDGTLFDASLDNFSCWVIETSLRALAKDPQLAQRFNACDDALLFRRNDFAHPEQSPVFYFLERHPDDEVKRYARSLRLQTEASIRTVSAPPIDLDMPELSSSDPPTANWYAHGTSERVDWEQLKQFYAVGGGTRLQHVYVNPSVLKMEESNQFMRMRNLTLINENQFGIAHLERLFTNKRFELRVCLGIIFFGLLFCCFTAMTYLVPVAVLWLPAALIIDRKTQARLQKRYESLAHTIMTEEPLDVLLHCRITKEVQGESEVERLTCKIVAAPPGYKRFEQRASAITDKVQIAAFLFTHDRECTIRVLVFVASTDGNPIAFIQEDDSLFWLIE